ncbi:ChaB family protein [Hyphomicrobium sp.]|uniref:ChaB family protein n=1 Tax=Hyphomicrobium sp. TaxID=82 RepID=UPI000FBECF88|nr:ChaB family protein [Hyphomicrobium sp.]MBN9246977.1 ChaB family protein [Hyphomicrobium sp.]RUP07949.1 MAG: cation transporter [Hyphomicrobium sp.]
MPYLANADLPRSVRRELPEAAQDIYRSTFNAAVDSSVHDPIEDADAHNLAWEAVKRVYVKEGDQWVRRGVLG